MDLTGGILIVDDSSTSRMIIQRCIEMAGLCPAEFFTAENGLEAMTVLKAHPAVKVVLTDINMPKMDGKAFIRLLRDDPDLLGVEAVVVSSIADAAVEEELRALGVARLVKKPVSPQKMLAALGGSA